MARVLYTQLISQYTLEVIREGIKAMLNIFSNGGSRRSVYDDQQSIYTCINFKTLIDEESKLSRKTILIEAKTKQGRRVA